MTLTQWDPFETLFGLQREIDSAFNKRLSPSQTTVHQKSKWLPAVDIHEDKEAFYFDVEAPGVEKNDFDIKVENSILVMRGERKRSEEKNEKNYYRIEREYGSFLRSFSLPDTADSDNVTAEYKNGVLHVKLGKKETAKPKQIQVQIA